MCDSCCSSTNDSVMEKCPVCNYKGQLVKNITVRNMVKSDLLAKINNNNDYYLCLNPECDNVYFNNELKQSFNKGDIRVDIWFKEKNPKRFICYCSEVTAQQIKDAVLGDNKARTVKDIVRLTNAMKQSNCQIKNPSGKCCRKAIQSVLNETLP